MYEKDFDKLARKYRRLLWKFVNKVNVANMAEEDVYQEMLMVLNFCNNTFDPTKGVRFLSYLYQNLRWKQLTLISESTLYKNRLHNEARSIDSFDDYYKKINVFEGAGLTAWDIHDVSIEKYKEDMEELKEKALQEEMIEELKKTPRGHITIDLIINEMSYKEVSKKYGVSHQYVYKAHKQNIENLKKLYKK